MYVSAGASGAHSNLAVTVALAAWRGFPWAKVGPYIGAQLAGAFVASVVVDATYADALTHFDGGVRQVTGSLGMPGILATYPSLGCPTVGGLVNQIVGTAALVLVVFALVGLPKHGPAIQPGAVSGRRDGHGHRHGLRAECRLCHQPRA